ncbi:MAG: Na+/H+ antiporter subunit E [Ignavibacteriaceae bacterium]|nr:Na+/H+ antiporter subunit E [Ignavibacteriaceae bacterium]
MQIKTKSRIVVFVFASLVWFALTDIKNYQEVLIGIAISALITFLAGQFLITTEKSQHPVKRFLHFLIYIFRFFWEMIKANLEVAYLVIHPMLPIKPGIVKIKTKLTKDSAITVLANSITLTPGTLTIDVNKEKQELYIHWIRVKSTDTDEATKEIGDKFEKTLMEVFE